MTRSRKKFWGIHLYERGWGTFLGHTAIHVSIGCIVTYFVCWLLVFTGRPPVDLWFPPVAGTLVGIISELGQFAGNYKPNVLDRLGDVAGYALGGGLTSLILLLLNR